MTDEPTFHAAEPEGPPEAAESGPGAIDPAAAGPDGADSSEAENFELAAFVRAHLLKEPLYLEDTELWNELLRRREEIAEWFGKVGLWLVVDGAEGFAYLREAEPGPDGKVPRLVQRRKLGYEATLLLVMLREELGQMEAREADQTRLVRSRRQIRDLVEGFLAETSDEVRDQRKIDGAIKQLAELGFLRRITGTGREEYEVRRIIKARVGTAELEEIKRKLHDHVGD
jgi:hypothetical protein